MWPFTLILGSVEQVGQLLVVLEEQFADAVFGDLSAYDDGVALVVLAEQSGEGVTVSDGQRR